MAMFLSSTPFHPSFSPNIPHSTKNTRHLNLCIRATTNAATNEPDAEKMVSQPQPTNGDVPKPQPVATKRPAKPVYSMKKGQIVRVEKEKYLNSINGIMYEMVERALQGIECRNNN